MRTFNVFVVAFLLLFKFSNGQHQRLSSTELHHEIQKLNFLGTALYVAAHPDDENQRMISYLSNKVKAKTAYLSITRGDGGQNLIGPELREQLGVLRTQELLAARSVDGGEQLFTRANDFGYSKHPDETFAIWDKKAVMGDLIWAIRTLKPDIIINRFNHKNPGSTHGHHTASAMLAFDAFDMTNDPKVYPEQMAQTEVWQPKRLFFNTSWWFYGGRDKFEKADKSNLTTVDIGVYYPKLGLSNNEIAAMARSQHKCQGFGQLTRRGSTEEYLEFLKGDPMKDKNNLFEGVNTTWTRIKGGEAIGQILDKVEANFNFADPSVHLPQLAKAYALLQEVENEHWKKIKSAHLKEIMLACGGIYLEANAATASATPGETIKVNLEAVNRSNQNITLNTIAINEGLATLTPSIKLGNNTKETFELSVSIPKDMGYTTPYWLQNEGSLGMYVVDDQELIGRPKNPAALNASFQLNIEGVPVEFESPVIRRYSKPDKGELFDPFVILPEVTASFDDEVMIFSNGGHKTVPVNIRAGKNNVSGEIELQAPKGWTVTPANHSFQLEKKEAIKTVYFDIMAPTSESLGKLKTKMKVNGKVFDQKLIEIDYDHIPKQSVLLPAEAKVVRLDIQKNGNSIGYIVGAGDKVPESLRQIGYEVELIDVESMQLETLNKFDGIVMGIRAYNVVDALKFKQPILLDYVKNGGNLIVQYNTAGRWAAQFENIAPYPLSISRERVTDENAKVDIIAPNHTLINSPNKIEPKDFDGWVQERGLYFPNQWSEEFTPILAMNDKGESVKKGSLLVASYGKGNYIYTGLSFFRELPVGVPGAYKLFANMLSLGNDGLENTEDARGKR